MGVESTARIQKLSVSTILVTPLLELALTVNESIVLGKLNLFFFFSHNFNKDNETIKTEPDFWGHIGILNFDRKAFTNFLGLLHVGWTIYEQKREIVLLQSQHRSVDQLRFLSTMLIDLSILLIPIIFRGLIHERHQTSQQQALNPSETNISSSQMMNQLIIEDKG